MRNFFKIYLKKIISTILIVTFLILSFYFLDADGMLKDIEMLTSRPAVLIFIFVSYFTAFLARGIAWKLYLKNRAKLMTCMYGLFYSLLLNHLLPVKAGDFARIGILKAREPEITSQEAINSVVILRLLDTGILFAMAIVGLVFLDLPVNMLFLLGLAGAGLVITTALYLRFRPIFNRHLAIMKLAFLGWQGLLIIVLTFASWILEAGVIYGVIINGGSDFSFVRAIWVNSITVAGQIFQITPGGIASYEAIMVFALGATGIPVDKGYSAAIITHGLKYIFTFIVGGAALAAYPIPIHILKKWTKERGNE